MSDHFAKSGFSCRDLYVHNYGEEYCKPGHKAGPSIRDFFIIHYIEDGKGTFRYEGKTWPLGAGELFLISPGIVACYEADEKEPWHYLWVGFGGERAAVYLELAGLGHKNPVAALENGDRVIRCIRDMTAAGTDYRLGQETRLQGLLHLFLAELIEHNTGDYIREHISDMGQYYIDKAVQYMSKNYSSASLSIASVARHVSLDRSYFSHLFSERMKTTPCRHLADIRLDKACELLILTSLSVGEVAASVGYKDYIVFSKAFKRKHGCSPSEYRVHTGYLRPR